MIDSEKMLETYWQCITWDETDFYEIDWDRIHWHKTSWKEIDWTQVDRVVKQANRQLEGIIGIRGLLVSRWHLIARSAGLWKYDEVVDYAFRCQFLIDQGLPPTPIEKYMAERVKSNLRYMNTLGLMSNRWGEPCGKPPDRPERGQYDRVKAFIEKRGTVKRTQLLKRLWRHLKAESLNRVVYWLVEDHLVQAEAGGFGGIPGSRPERYTWIGDRQG